MFSPSNKIHREVGRAKNLSAPLYNISLLLYYLLVLNNTFLGPDVSAVYIRGTVDVCSALRIKLAAPGGGITSSLVLPPS